MTKRATLRGLCCLFAMTWSGCGSSKFSEQFAPEIERDCTETVACTTSQLTADSDLDGCITKAGAALDKAPVATQQLFVDTVERCSLSTQCPYVTCTQADPTVGFASMHQVEINWDCTQRTACRVNANQTGSANAVSDCVGTTSAALNANPEEQDALVTKYAHCQSMAGCAWNSCQ